VGNQKVPKMSRPARAAVVGVIALALLTSLTQTGIAAPPLSGAVFTTNAGCTDVNINIFAAKADVYLDGGPAHPGSAGLPDGSYFVKVTTPAGADLGLPAALTPQVTVAGGEFVSCYQLAAILVTASSKTPGYDTTTNPGGEYKVWVSTVATFDNSSTKTDNFKVKGPDPENPGLPQATLDVVKFYDANANGLNDDGQPITGWLVHIVDGIDIVRSTPVHIIVAPDTYTVTEFTPVETNWMRTTPNPVDATLADQSTTTVQFGNLCLGSGGGLTLGFWSNKNGQAQFGADDLALMTAVNLRNANGSAFDPGSYTVFRTWLLSANAANMAYMLSAQLAAMELNVLNNKVAGAALIYAPGTASANTLGFATVSAVMAEADASLAANGNTTAAGPARTSQEALKNALDMANNNKTFVQAAPCTFSFGSS
jgi:hypothetical protein